MTERAKLPNRRRHHALNVEHNGHPFALGFSSYRDGSPAEIFLSSPKVGTAIEAVARDAAIIVSIALQHSADLEVLAHAITRDDDGRPASLIGTALDALRSQIGGAA
jgi:hypothetical protein